MTRDQVSDIFSAALIQKIFTAQPGAVVFGPGSAGGGFIVARVSGVAHPPLAPTDPRYRQGLQQLSSQIAQDIVDGLAKSERAKLGVTINQKLLNQAVGGEGGS